MCSVVNILKALDCAYAVTSNAAEVARAERLILPGQGHFGQVMNSLKEKNLDRTIIEAVNNGKPFLGICVGLQILFETSEEAPGVSGLGLVEGKVVKFTKGKIPQIGWNQLKLKPNNTILSADYYYFVNSYYVKPKNSNIISSTADYYGEFCASIEKDNLTAVQFHPEKSGACGLETIKKWVNNDG